MFERVLNTSLITMKKFIFSEAPGQKNATLLNMNFFFSHNCNYAYIENIERSNVLSAITAFLSLKILYQRKILFC